MSKTFIFVKNGIYHDELFFYIFLFLFEEINLVTANDFGIVRLKTQSEKYMALKDEISKLVFLLKNVIISS